MQIDPVSAVIALLALGVAIWANVQVRSANRSASDSARAAERSAEAAEAANKIAQSEHARAVERSDVEWSLERSGDTVLARNLGSTEAVEVRAVVRAGSVRLELSEATVEPDQSLTFNLTEAFGQHRESNQRTVTDYSRSGISYFPSSSIEVSVRITWESPGGTPQVRALHERL